MNSLISIIIPIYNAERYLQECLDSVMAQSYCNFELLLIDDGSKDASADICKRYAMSDERIRYIYQENAGVSAARNKGLDMAHGMYISFVDADDIVADNFLQCMVTQIGEHDLVCCGVVKLIGERQLTTVSISKTTSLSQLDAIICLLSKGSFEGYSWNKLFRRDLIIEYRLSFDSAIKYGEDLLFVFKYLEHCKSIVFIQEKLYFYRLNIDSSLHVMQKTSSINPKFIKDFVAVYDYMYNSDLLADKTAVKELCFSKQFVLHYNVLINHYMVCKDFTVSLQDEMINVLRRYRKYYTPSSYIESLGLKLLMFSPTMFRLVRRGYHALKQNDTPL